MYAMGRHHSFDIELPARVVQDRLEDRRLSLRTDAQILQVSQEPIRSLRHQPGYHFYDSIPMPALSDDVKRRRVEFCREQFPRDDFAFRPIAFTDESMIRRDLNLGGIWRQKGEQLDDAGYVQVAHEISVMIWDAMSNEFRSKSVRCPELVNSHTYMEYLADSHIFYQCIQKFGMDGFYWQHDNPPSQGPGGEVFKQRFNMIN
jgi:hypothetical protein